MQKKNNADFTDPITARIFTSYEYKFNTITDEDVKGPDINEYRVQ